MKRIWMICMLTFLVGVSFAQKANPSGSNNKNTQKTITSKKEGQDNSKTTAPQQNTSKESTTTDAPKPAANVSSCPDNHHPHLIDLGLPSGTKWACCNVGASTPEGYGDYYSWGETSTKANYSWKTYNHCKGSANTCTKLGSDITGTNYDVARKKWGGSWKMPTIKQFLELSKRCRHTLVSVNGVNGRKFTGPNGNSIFLPFAGSKFGTEFGNVGNNGYYWSSNSNLRNVGEAYYLFVTTSGYAGRSYYYRYYGHSIRPVQRPAINKKK